MSRSVESQTPHPLDANKQAEIESHDRALREAKPETFRNGTRILVGTFRQQVLNNTVTGSFTTFHQVMVTSTRPFATAHGKVKLGRLGQAFRIAFAGQGNMPGPPSGFFGGYGLSG